MARRASGDPSVPVSSLVDWIRAGVRTRHWRVRIGRLHLGKHADEDRDLGTADHHEAGAVRLCRSHGNRSRNAVSVVRPVADHQWAPGVERAACDDMTTQDIQLPKSNVQRPKSKVDEGLAALGVSAPSRRRLTEPAVVRLTLIVLTLAFLLLFLVLPMGVVFVEAFRNGLRAYADAVKEPDALAALKLTMI